MMALEPLPHTCTYQLFCFHSRPTPVSALMAQYAFQEKLFYSKLVILSDLDYYCTWKNNNYLLIICLHLINQLQEIYDEISELEGKGGGGLNQEKRVETDTRMTSRRQQKPREMISGEIV